MVVIPCSARERPSGTPNLAGPSVLDLLPATLGNRLAVARSRIARHSDVDESRLMPAWRRYAGTFYDAAGSRLGRAVGSAEVSVVILSGAYGLVVAAEPIGVYNRVFEANDWPSGLLEECLLVVAHHVGARRAWRLASSPSSTTTTPGPSRSAGPTTAARSPLCQADLRPAACRPSH